jgi:hypothetical protein
MLSVGGLSQQNYKSHSFRIGAATTAAMDGISENKISRWDDGKVQLSKSTSEYQH